MGRVSNIFCSSFGSLCQWWECFQHAPLLRCVLGSMVGSFPTCPAPPLGSWVNDGNASTILCSSTGSLGQQGVFPTCPAPPLIPWVNGGIISKRPHFSVVSLGQWWECFQHTLLFCCVLGSMVGALPTCPTPPLHPWVNDGNASTTLYSSITIWGQRGASPPLAPLPTATLESGTVP